MAATEEPIVPGWYRYAHGQQILMFLLNNQGDWWVFDTSGNARRTTWDYISQALYVFDLVLVVKLGVAA